MAVKKIVVRGEELCVFGEAKLDAGVDITPGMLIDWASATEVAPHGSAAAAHAQRMFATETNQRLVGQGIDDAYDADGEMVSYVVAPRGALIYAWLEDEGNVAYNAALESDGAGALQALSTGAVVAYAREAVNNTGGSGAVRILVEVA
jgi:hypothetical protein